MIGREKIRKASRKITHNNNNTNATVQTVRTVPIKQNVNRNLIHANREVDIAISIDTGYLFQTESTKTYLSTIQFSSAMLYLYLYLLFEFPRVYTEFRVIGIILTI